MRVAKTMFGSATPVQNLKKLLAASLSPFCELMACLARLGWRCEGVARPPVRAAPCPLPQSVMQLAAIVRWRKS